MATEAFDLPHNVAITVRLPRRLRVLLRALRIAKARRTLKLYRELADRADGIRPDGNANPNRDGRTGWLTEAVLMYQQN